MTDTQYYQIRTLHDGPHPYTVTVDKDTIAGVTSTLLSAANEGRDLREIRVDCCEPASTGAARDFRDKPLWSLTADEFLAEYSK